MGEESVVGFVGKGEELFGGGTVAEEVLASEASAVEDTGDAAEDPAKVGFLEGEAEAGGVIAADIAIAE